MSSVGRFSFYAFFISQLCRKSFFFFRMELAPSRIDLLKVEKKKAFEKKNSQLQAKKALRWSNLMALLWLHCLVTGTYFDRRVKTRNTTRVTIEEEEFIISTVAYILQN